MSEQKADPRPMDDAKLALIARLSPDMAPVVAALSYPPEDDIPAEFPPHSSAFETLSATHPVLASAISVYVNSEVHHGESLMKLVEDASRAMFGLAPMTDAEERAWMHRHDAKPAPVAQDPKNGPTIAEWVGQGYTASSYPPAGYEPRSTPAEIEAAVNAEKEHDDKVKAAKDREFKLANEPIADPVLSDPSPSEIYANPEHDPAEHQF